MRQEKARESANDTLAGRSGTDGGSCSFDNPSIAHLDVLCKHDFAGLFSQSVGEMAGDLDSLS